MQKERKRTQNMAMVMTEQALHDFCRYFRKNFKGTLSSHEALFLISMQNHFRKTRSEAQDMVAKCQTLGYASIDKGHVTIRI